MTSAYILIIAILLLGGLIAALGDRIGTKVGKARLRLFKLRPKQTAILITIGTGTLISASTLIILFSLSESLRQGVFQLDEILRKRREITVQLERVQDEKETVEKELIKAQNRQNTVLNQLTLKENELSTTQKQVKEIQKRSEFLRKEVEKIIQEKDDLLIEKDVIQAQSLKLEESIAQRDQELQSKQGQIEEQEKILQQQQKSLERLKNRQEKLELEISGRDEQIRELDRLISQTEGILKAKEQELASLETQLDFYRQEVEILEQYYQTYQDLRERPIAIIRGQVLTVTLVQVGKDTELGDLVDAVLNQANRSVMQILGYGNQPPMDRFVQITKGQVEQIKQQLSPPGQYLIRILSAGNYVQGEERIRIFADVTPNQIVYQQNEAIASITIEEKEIKSGELQEKLEFLISVSQFRARQKGISGQIVIGDGNIVSLINFMNELQSLDQNIDEVFTVAANNTYTAGPLQIQLVALSDGKEVFRL